MIENRHNMSWKQAKILDYHKFTKSRKILESFYSKSEGSFNRYIDLPQTYTNLGSTLLKDL